MPVSQTPSLLDAGLAANNDDARLYACFFDNRYDVVPKERLLTWGEACEILTTFDVRQEQDGPLWSPVSYLPGTQRAKGNVRDVWALQLDLDHGARTEELEPAWQELEYVVYSTFSNERQKGKEGPCARWRVVFPLARPVQAGEWPEWYAAAATALAGSHWDRQCTDPNRMCYLPVSPDGENVFRRRHRGRLLDPAQFRPAPKPERAPVPAASLSPALGGKGDYGTLDVAAWFQAHGCYGRPLADSGRHAVRCPWEHEHSTGKGANDTDTVVWESGAGRWPEFCCQHEHCKGRGIRDVIALWGDADLFCREEFSRTRAVEFTPVEEAPKNGKVHLPAPDTHTEDQVLGALILCSDIRPAVLSLLQRSDFEDAGRRAVFCAVAGLAAAKAPVNEKMVIQELERAQALELIGGSAGLHWILADACLPSDAEYWAKQLSGAGDQRRAVRALEEALAQAKSGKVSDALARAQLAAQAAKAKAPAPYLSAGSTAAELWVKEIPKRVPLVDGLIYEGLNLLVGGSKVGKSWFILQTCIAMHYGGKALGCFDCSPSEVLYLALEDKEERLQKRLRTLYEIDPGLDPTKLERLHFRYQWPMLGDGAEEAFVNWCDRHPGTRAIVVDVFQKLRPRAKRNAGNAYQEDYLLLGPLQTLAMERHIALILLHHTNKLKGEDAFDSISGSTGIMGAADTALVMKRGRNDPSGTLLVTGRDCDEKKLSLEFKGGLWTCRGDADEVEMSEKRREVLDAFLQHGNEPMTPANVAGMTSFASRQAARQCLVAMQSKGILITQPGGKYQVSAYYLESARKEEE